MDRVKDSCVEMSCNQFPALLVTLNYLEFLSSVNGNHKYGFYFEYELDTPYHIEISQSKVDGITTYNILISNSTSLIQQHSINNTTPGAILLFTTPV